MIYKLASENLTALYDRIAERMILYLPIEEDGIVNFRRYKGGDAVRLDALNADKSPKDLFFPQYETMMRFKVDGKSIEVIQQELQDEPFVVMGVRACDERAFDVLDRVFLAEPEDTFYAARRKNGTVVTLSCAKPDQTCFCAAFGIDAASPSGDAAAWLVGGDMLIKPLTEKGEAFVQIISDLLTEADEKQLEDTKAEIRAAVDKLPYSHLSLEGFDGEHMNELFRDEKWQSLSEACLGCGTCTFHCPTCQCYDIRDYDTGHGIERYRCWDSCMYSDFTMMAAETPRPTQMQRFRQRFMHKLVYYPANNDGLYSCVGCGRCVRKCPIHMNIVKVIKALGGKKA